MTSQFLSQQLPLFAVIRPVAFVTSSPTQLKPWGWFAFSVTNQAFLAPQLWEWPIGSTTQFDHWLWIWEVEAEGGHVLDFWRTGLRRLKQCSRHSWDQRKGKEEDTNSHNKNWRYVTGLHSRPTRLFSFLDNNAAKSWDCQAESWMWPSFLLPFLFILPLPLPWDFFSVSTRSTEHFFALHLNCPCFQNVGSVRTE